MSKLFLFLIIVFIISHNIPIVYAQPAGFYGDANEDGGVDGLDYVIWLNNYGVSSAGGSYSGDFNSDGVTDGLDYVIWLNNYGLTITPTATPTPTATATPSVNADVTVYPENNGYAAKNNSSGEIFSDAHAWKVIQHAIDSISSGTVYLSAGKYYLGEDNVIANNPRWTSKNSSVTVNNTSTGYESTATKINIPYPAPTGLVACYTFPSSISLKEAMALGFWFKPSINISSRDYGYTANSHFKFWIDNSANCASPEYTQSIYHPEWVTSEWKWYRIPGSPAMSALSSSIASVRSIGIEIYNNSSLPTPSQAYSISIDDIHTTTKGYITLGSNKKLIGAGAGKTTLFVNDHANIPAIILAGSNSEIAHLEINGNYNNQDSIDQSAGIYNSSGSSDSIHHTYIHHTKGTGIKTRGGNHKIYENKIEWTENAQVELVYSEDNSHVYDNTLKYAFNDDNIWVRDTSGHVIENNDLYGIDRSILTQYDTPKGVSGVGDWNGIRVDYGSSNITIKGNRISNVGGYGIAVTSGGSTSVSTSNSIVQNNRVYNSVKTGIAVQLWGGTSISGIQVIGNYVSGGSARGIDIGGTKNVIKNNWTYDNSQQGIYLSGSGHTGSGNYLQGSDGFTDGSNGSSVTTSSTSPMIPEFKGGVSW